MGTTRDRVEAGREAVIAVDDLRHAFLRFDSAPTFSAQAHAAELIAEKASTAAVALAEFDRLRTEEGD